MAKKPRNRIALAQNFLRSSKLVRALIAASSIGPFDTVYEIGPGGGIITAELAQTARKVIAFEKDPALAYQLHRQFQHIPNVNIVEGDFLQYCIPDRKYKLFANIPYNLTAAIVRQILHSSPAASEAYLIMQKEAAEKFAGSPKETQFSILVKPRYSLQIIRELRRTDFEPVPAVDSVLLRITKRHSPLIREEDAALYNDFICHGFGMWKKSLKLSFKQIFTYPQWKRLSRDLRFPLDATPTELTFEQWLGLFDFFMRGVPMNKHAKLKSEIK